MIQAGNFNVNMWNMRSSPDPAHYERMLVCNGSANHSRYCNPELDKCLLEAGSLYDANKRAEIYKRCQKIIYDDALDTGLYLETVAIIHRKELKGLRFEGADMDLREAWLDK